MKRVALIMLVMVLTFNFASCKAKEVSVELTSVELTSVELTSIELTPNNFFDYFQITQTLDENSVKSGTSVIPVYGTITIYDRTITVFYTVAPKMSLKVDSPITVDLSVGSSGNPDHWKEQNVSIVILDYGTEKGEVVFRDRFSVGGAATYNEFEEAAFVVQSVTGQIRIER